MPDGQWPDSGDVVERALLEMDAEIEKSGRVF